MITENVLMFLGTLAAIVSAILIWNKFSPALVRKSVDLAQVDLSAPLRGRDLLANEGILKLAYRWGVWKAVFLYWLFYGATIGGALYALTWGAVLPEVNSRLDILYIVRYAFICTTITTIMMYRQITKALRALDLRGDRPIPEEELRQ